MDLGNNIIINKMVLQSALLILLLYTLPIQSLKISQFPSNGTPPPKRVSHASTYNPLTNTLYIYGGKSESDYLEDMWEYNFNTNQWKEIHSPSVIVPGPRYSATMQLFPGGKLIAMFGGVTTKGPISDLWVFSTETYMVITTQWSTIDFSNFSSVSSAFNAICGYEYNGRGYMASFGGSSFNGIHNRLTILDMQTWSWSEPEYTGTPPEPVNSPIMAFVNGGLHVLGGVTASGANLNGMYRYELATNTWMTLDVKGLNLEVEKYVPVMINLTLYAFFGLNETRGIAQDIYKIDFSKGLNAAWELVEIEKEADFSEELPRIETIMVPYQASAIMFGGWNSNGNKNDLIVFDLCNINAASDKIKYRTINKSTAIPPSRLGHRMDFYQDNLLVFGGRDKNNNL